MAFDRYQRRSRHKLSVNQYSDLVTVLLYGALISSLDVACKIDDQDQDDVQVFRAGNHPGPNTGPAYLYITKAKPKTQHRTLRASRW